MDVSAISHAGHGTEGQAKAAASENQPPPPSTQGDLVEISDDAKTLASKSVLDE